MYYKISNQLDMKLLKQEKERVFSENSTVSELVLSRMDFYLELLDECYGDHRNFESDGGYLLLFTKPDTEKERSEVFNYYGLKEEEAEVREIIFTDEEHLTEWVEELYVLTEFHIILFYPRKVREEA